MKKVLCIIFAAVMVLSALTACSDNTASAPETAAAPETTAPETAAETAAETEAETEQMAGLANPMVEISDPAEFEKQLGIHIDPKEITNEYKMFIIDGKLAHVVWTQKNVENEDVELVLRATKDPEIAPTMHGIFGSISEPAVITDEKGKPLPDLKQMTCDNYTIYTWKIGDTFYSLTYDKGMSGNAMSSVLDCVAFAIGAMRMTKDVLPLPVNVDAKNIADGIYKVFVEKDGIREENGKYIMACEVYTEELFDSVELTALKPGDTVAVGGNRIEVRTAEDKNGEILINGGDEGDGGCTFAPAEGGTYVYRGPDDIASYQNHGRTELEMAENVVLTDTSDIDNGCKEVVVKGAPEVAGYLASSTYARLSPSSGNICVEKGKVVEIKTWYTP